MLIEIHGAGFANKGAQLMLETVIDKIRSRDSSARFAIATGSDRPHRKTSQLGIELIWPSGSYYGGQGKTKRLLRNIASKCVSRSLLRPYGVVTRNEVDALIDISGYAFGDLWGVKPLDAILPLADFYRRRKRPVVLLPQMFGPFEKKDVADAFTRLSRRCDMIYARDKISFEACKRILPNGPIRLAPDITICSATKTGAAIVENEDRVCLVPNVRMTDKGSSPWNETDYLAFFVKCARRVHEKGKKIVVVIHESLGEDSRLAEKLVENIGLQDIAVHTESDPKVLKKYIGASRFVIGSRFHSLVAALSSNVPVIAIGWAHKYDQLLGDYGQEQFVFKGKSFDSECDEMIRQLSNDDDLNRNKDLIRNSNIRIASQSEEMWADVFQILKLPNSSSAN